MKPPYTASPFAPRRRSSREVRVGDVGVGGSNPIRVQSMTTTDTLDTDGTVAQVEALAGAGCEIVRITAPSRKDAENLGPIARELHRRGVRVPLVADIHYTPGAALIAAEHVEKVRVNPGNYADKKKFEVRDYSDAEYAEQVERAGERFRPLVRRLKELGRALRIGTNHGSLADRILNRFGDTPLGMVESALEFLDVCEDEGYRDVIFSMKASNTQVAIQAYRLLAARLAERRPGEPGYPLHVGVTEAGDGADGRIKSAIGIGALLEDGLGDTIRVSLTESPVAEVPVAAALARRAEALWAAGTPAPEAPGAAFCDDPYAHRRRATRPLGELGGSHPVRVELRLGAVTLHPEQLAAELDAALTAQPDLACEGLGFDLHDGAELARLEQLREALAALGRSLPIVVRTESRHLELGRAAGCQRWVVPVGALVEDADLRAAAESARRSRTPLEWQLRTDPKQVTGLVDRVLDASAAAQLENFAVSVEAEPAVHAVRAAAARLRARGGADVPIVLRHRRQADAADEAHLLDLAVGLGAPLCDGIGDAVVLDAGSDPGRALDLAYRVLQGARLRTTRTEFISCPSCGRTLFDLEETTARIKARTEHLPGVKIAVMGCIVNGPGEMADADFGYVGSGPGTVNLFVGHECVERHVPASEATDRLVDLIRDHGRWVEPDA